MKLQKASTSNEVGGLLLVVNSRVTDKVGRSKFPIPQSLTFITDPIQLNLSRGCVETQSVPAEWASPPTSGNGGKKHPKKQQEGVCDFLSAAVASELHPTSPDAFRTKSISTTPQTNFAVPGLLATAGGKEG